MSLLKTSTICPFCFSTFSAQEIRFRCGSLNCSGRATDDVYAKERGFGAVPMGRVLLAPKRQFGLPQSAECDACNKETRTRLCPKCHFELSHDVGQIDQRIIAIIGGSNTGKSHYIATLVHKLQHELGENFHFGLAMLGDNTRSRWLKDFYNPLFEKKTVLNKTMTSGVNSEVKNPLLFRLTLQHGHSLRALNLSFFDTAGEDMTSLTLDTLSSEARYISQADGIIVLLDPLQIESVRQLLPPSIKLPHLDPKASPEIIIARLRELLELRQRLSATTRVKIPVALTLSKIDTLRSIVDASSTLLRTSEHSGVVDLEAMQSVHTEVQSYLRSWISSNFTEEVKLKFANAQYFGVSSLGGQPDENNHLATISPIHVEDPFLWILHQFHLVKGKKGS